MLTFWSKRFEEKPAPPVGLVPKTERRTYDEAGADQPAPATEGG
jgi:hypothetical protein